MKSVSERALVAVAVCAVFIFTLLPSLGIAETKKIVRAVYNSGLVLQEEPAGTVLADPSTCLTRAEGAQRYDYKGQLVKTVEKANTRMSAQVLEQKIAGYEGSISLLDRNIALLSGTIDRAKQLDGLSGYLVPIGAQKTSSYSGAKFEGKCYKAPGAEQFGSPDALGELNPLFDATHLYAETSPEIEKALKEELPQKLNEFIALEKAQPVSKKEKKAKEERFAVLTEEVMAKVGDFMAIDPVVASQLMPREFGGRGTKLSSTPSITLTATTEACTYVVAFGMGPAGKMYDITVNAVSATHTFRKCMPEEIALGMLKDQLEAKKKLLQKERANLVKALSSAGKALAGLQKGKPQYFGD